MLHKRGFFGAFLLITFSCQFDQLVGVCSDSLNKRGIRHGSGAKNGGNKHGSGQKGGSVPRIYVNAHRGCTIHEYAMMTQHGKPYINSPHLFVSVRLACMIFTCGNNSKKFKYISVFK